MTIATDQAAMLHGVRIIDLTSVVFGPYCTQILAELGAEVLKIEGPKGDQYRYSGRSPVTPGMSPGFFTINRGKSSMRLDLKVTADREKMRDLIKTADVFIHNVRGKSVKRLGLDYEACRILKEDIIYAHCVGFGQDGPYADEQAYDDVIQAASGAATLLPRVDGDARPRYLPSLIADKVAGLHAAYGVLAAIIHKLRTGRGQQVVIPMFEAFTHFLLLEHLGGAVFEPATGEVGYSRQLDPDRQPFPTRDGYISIVPYTDDTWLRLLSVLGAEDVLLDGRLADRSQRNRHQSLLYEILGKRTAKHKTAELLQLCHAAQIPARPVRDLADLMTDPHLTATNFFRYRHHESEGQYREMKHPIQFSEFVNPLLSPPPHIDQHRQESYSF